MLRSNVIRLTILRAVIGTGFIFGIVLSLRLWFPTARSFPRAPLIVAFPDNVVPALEYLLSVLLLFALVALIFVKRPFKYLIAAIILLSVLVVLDQTRLQPWVYQYLLLFVVTALYYRQHESARISLPTLQLIVASLYFWGGIQKLNYSFAHEVLPQILASLQNGLMLSQTQLSVLGVAIAGMETLIGCGLLVRKTRWLAVWLALAMHASILVLLIVQGRNSVVWIWNAALVLIVMVLFWRSDTSLVPVFSGWREANASARLSIILAVVCAVLPVLSFRGWWDMYLSSALYSGNTVVAVVRLDGPTYKNLPAVAKRQIFAMKSGEQMLPFFEWSMADLNVPPYPERRVFIQVARAVCKFGGEDSHAELIMKGSPAILDGSYQVTRIDCSHL